MVYLIHFDKAYHHAQHYIGYVDGDAPELMKRLTRHRNGTGANLLNVLKKAGVTFQVVRVWPGADRTFERKLKNRKKARELCPICSGEVCWNRAKGDK